MSAAEHDPGSLDTAPGQGNDDITPADTDFARPYRSVYVGTGGAGTKVVVTGVDGTIATWWNPPTGSIIPVACKRVGADTTATNLVGIR